MLTKGKNIILQVIDFFYPLFSKWIDPQTFRYLACGGGNTMLDIILYFISYNFILDKQPIHVWGITITPHIAAFLNSFVISFPLGFILSKYIVFPHSNLQGKVQLFRYILMVSTCILLNYVFLKLFVEWCHFYATVSKILTTILVAVFSYISQRNFTFKVKEETIVPVLNEEESIHP